MSCCKNPIIQYFEFEIPNNIFVSNEKNLNIPIQPETDIELLKDKIICEFLWVITQLEKGNQPDISMLLDAISVVDVESEIDNREFIIQYYLNNIWKENIQ